MFGQQVSYPNSIKQNNCVTGLVDAYGMIGLARPVPPCAA